MRGGVTRSRTHVWVAQQLREVTPFRTGPKYIIRDNDTKYGQHFEAVAVGSGIEVLRTPMRAPRANAICGRSLGSVRRECLDHILLVSEPQLRCVLKEYVTYFNGSRPHQRINQRVPDREARSGPARHRKGTVIAFPILGGLHHASIQVAYVAASEVQLERMAKVGTTMAFSAGSRCFRLLISVAPA